MAEKDLYTEREQAFDQAKLALVREANRLLKEQYEIIRLAYPELAKAKSAEEPNGVDDAYFNRMVKDAVVGVDGKKDVRGFRAKKTDGNEIFISFEEVDKKLIKVEEYKQMLGAYHATGIAQLIPTEAQVNSIASALADAVNDEYKEGLSCVANWECVKNGASGALSWATDKEGTVEGAFANAIKDTAIKKLGVLAKNDASLKSILDKKSITVIAEGLHDGVLKTHTEKELAEEKAKKDGKEIDPPKRVTDFYTHDLTKIEVKAVEDAKADAIRKKAKDIIYDRVEEQAEKNINDGINEKIDGLKKGGWFDSVQAFFFKLFDLFGAGNWLIKKFTPGQEEIVSASRQVAETVSKDVTGEGFKKYYDSIQANPSGNQQVIDEPLKKELSEKIKTEVAAELKKNSSLYGDFSSENLDEIASKTGDAIVAPDILKQIKTEVPDAIYKPKTATAAR